MVLENVTFFSLSVDDRRVWKLEKSELFTCKSIFKDLVGGSSLFQPHSFIWKAIPPNIKVFSWLLVLRKLNTHDILQKHRPFLTISPSWCVLCKRINETLDSSFHTLLLHLAYGLGY